MAAMGSSSFFSVNVVSYHRVLLALLSLVDLGLSSKFHNAPDKVFHFLSV